MSAQKAAAKAGGNGKGKKPTGAKGKGNNHGEEETEEILKAIVLADDFDTRFRPFTEEKPRCLLPLANTPLIDYTLEWLALSGVSEVFIYPGPDAADQVEAYIRNSKWSPRSNPSPFQVVEVIVSKATSLGEAMRDVDRRKIMYGDFLVVHGDLVCNVPIAHVLERHKARKLKDKNSIMTMLLGMGGDSKYQAMMRNHTPVFAIDAHKRCLHYEEISPLQPEKFVRIAADVLSDHSSVDLRSDLYDCGIDICTPDVLALWSDEFDYQEPRNQFLHGVLKDFELNGKTIYTELLKGGYAARVNNLQAYDTVSKDLIGRWTYPLVPDSNTMPNQTYKSVTDGIIKEDGVVLSRNGHLGEKTVVGSKTSIGGCAQISNCTIGRRCQIGKNVTIQDAYIWDDVVIGDGAHITQSIIGSEAVIGSNTIISRGTVLSFGVRIDDNMTVSKGKRITRGDRQSACSSDLISVGEKGSGYIFEDDEEPEDAIEAQLQKKQNHLFYSMAELSISVDSLSTFTSEISRPVSPSHSRRLSTGSFSDDGDANGFHHDAVEGLYITLQENGDFDSAKLEFMGLRLSNNATDKQIRRAIAVAFTKNMATLIAEENLDPLKAVKKSLDTHSATTFIREVGIGKAKVVQDQVEFLLEVQRDLCSRSCGAEILFALCQQLYERDVVEEEGFEAWWADGRGTEGGEMRAVRGRAEAFVRWLREADEEGSEEEEESGEDGEEESSEEE